MPLGGGYILKSLKAFPLDDISLYALWPKVFNDTVIDTASPGYLKRSHKECWPANHAALMGFQPFRWEIYFITVAFKISKEEGQVEAEVEGGS